MLDSRIPKPIQQPEPTNIFRIRFVTSSTIISILILLSLISPVIGETGCEGATGYSNCGTGITNCYEQNDGTFIGCDDDSPFTGYAEYNFGTNTDSGISMSMIRKCDQWCASCDGMGNPGLHCQSCNSGHYKWVTSDTCYNYCPSVYLDNARNNYGFTTDSVGQFPSSSTTCSLCSS